MTVYFFYGEEDLNLEAEIEEMKSKLNPDFISMSFQTLYSPGYQELITALRTPPMMFGDTLIVINCEKYFITQKNNKYVLLQKNVFTDSELDDIESSLESNPAGLNIVFALKLPRNESLKPDSRKRLFKVLSKFNAKEFVPFKTYKTAEIVGWIKNAASKKDIKIDNDAALLLVEQLGNNLRQINNELEKLKLMAYPNKTVTKSMVQDISISLQDLFNMTEFLLTNRRDMALAEFKKLTDKKHPLEILSTVQTMLKKWIILKIKSVDMSYAQLAKLTGFHEYVVQQTLQKLKNTKTADLVRLKHNLLEVEYKIKSAEALDINSEVELALIR